MWKPNLTETITLLLLLTFILGLFVLRGASDPSHLDLETPEDLPPRPFPSSPQSEGEEELLQAFSSESLSDPSDLFLPIGEVHRAGHWHRGSLVYIYDPSLGFLLVRRGFHMKTCPGHWTPVGEHTKIGESPLDAARRGLEEETGLRDLGRIREVREAPFVFDYVGEERVDRQVTTTFVVVLDRLLLNLTEDATVEGQREQGGGGSEESRVPVVVGNSQTRIGYLQRETTGLAGEDVLVVDSESNGVWFLSPQELLDASAEGGLCSEYLSAWVHEDVVAICGKMPELCSREPTKEEGEEEGPQYQKK